MSKVKAGGTAKNLRDSGPKYLGVKLYNGEKAKVGSIIVRQRGTAMLAGKNVAVGKDHTLFAMKAGIVKFGSKRKTSFTGKITRKPIVSIE